MLYDPKWEVQTKTDPWRNILLKAADLIRNRGLAEDGSMCLHGAISVAASGRPYEEDNCEAAFAVARYLQAQGVSPELASEDGCAPWNNQIARTAEEVIAALEGTARA